MSIKLRANVSGFTAGLRAAQTDTTNLGRKMTETGAAADQMRRRLEAATKALPKIEIDADSSAAEVKFAQLRRDLETLASKKIGVDVDAGVARAEIGRIEDELARLQRTEVDVNVRADIGTALAELRAVDVELKRVDGHDARVQVDADVGGALASIAMVGAALAALPAVTTLAVGVTALGGAFAAAGLGAAGFAAVAVPSMGRVSEALKAQETAANAAGGATSGAGQSAAQAAQQAMQLEQAEKRLTDAQKDERQAQEDLTRAREDGRRALEDMNFSLERSILSQKDAALAVREAEARLQEVMADPESSALDIERAMLSVEQAHQRAREQEVKTQRAKKDTAAANKAGVKGTQEYQRAQENVIAAQEKVAQAEQQLKVLRLQQKEAMSSAGGAAGGLKDALADLSKEERAMVKDLEAFQKGYEKWQRSLQPDVFPAIRQGMDLVLLGLDKIGPGVSGAGKAFTTLGKDAEAALRGPFWTDFFNDVNAEIPGAITSLGHVGMDVFTGLAGVIKAFLPYADDVTAALERGSETFADWGTGLGDSDGFQRFLMMVREDGPIVVEALGNLAKAAAPLGGISVTGLSLLARVLADMSPEQIRGVAIAVGAVYTAVKGYQTVSGAVGWYRDLAGSISKAGDTADAAKGRFSGLGGSLKAAGIAGVVLGIAGAADNLADSLTGLNPDIDKLARGMSDFVRGGQPAPELMDQIAGKVNVLDLTQWENFGDISSRLASDNPFWKISSDFSDSVKEISGGLITMDSGAQRMSNIDQALATMVRSGNGDQAAKMFSVLTRMAGDAGVPMDRLKQQLPEYTRAIGATTQPTNAAALAIQGAKAAMDNLNGAVSKFAGRTDALVAVRNMEAAYKDATVALEGTNGKLSVNHDMVASQRDAVILAREKFSGYIDSIRTAADGSATLSGKTEDATRAVLEQLPNLAKLAGKSGEAKEEILKLAQAYGISRDDAIKAMSSADGLRDVLDKLESKEIRIFVKTEYQDELSREALRQANKHAEGGIYGVGGHQYMADGGIRDVAGPVLMAWGGVRSVGADPGAMIATGPKLISGRAGPDVVFGEAGAEAYIPLAPNRRARGLEVLTAAANIMGQTVMPAAAGSSVSSSSTTIGGSVTNVGGAVTSIGGARTTVGGSYGSRISSPTTINSSQVSRPVSGGTSGGGWSSADVAQIAGQLATIVSRLDAMERRNPVTVENMQVREQADVGAVAAALYSRLGSKGR
ncbi:hypothetical protein [Streptosporangium pseudovulgare]|uniref:hypothetical protein n=1 Tax=Streptosporangium pseudovulgare TaxID=35765 RepID=UPI0016710774|nr:hypothetical protein [Streptosporangium pseudovulgare]